MFLQVMAAEMSCLTGVDADDKDADPEINALTLMQEPLRMTTCTDSFTKSLCQSNSVLDVLSSEDMLSPVGLGNGPSVHQPTEAHELNSFSNDKDEEKNITPLKTVQELGGMWDFDIDSPEDSSDNFNSPSNLSWDSPRTLCREEPKEEAPPPDIPKRRKRKMDMVVMVDPSEELFPPDDEDQFPVKKGRKPRMSPSRMSPSRKESKYTNGTVKPIKHVLYSPPTTNSKQNSLDHELSPLKSRLSINSYSEKPLQYPCLKCNLVFKKQHLLDYHMKSHTEQLRPYVCKECGKSFKKGVLLIEHMAVHKQNLNVEKKSSKDKPQLLYCPQCSFGTRCPNEFVQHAKTHQKDKRNIYYKCEKCNFTTDDESFLKKHNIMQHTVLSPKKTVEKKTEKEIFTCNICSSYKTFSKLVFKSIYYDAMISRWKSTKLNMLDESINVLLSRQRRGPMAIDQGKEANGNSSEKDPYELPESPLSQNDHVPSERNQDPSFKRKRSSLCHFSSRRMSMRGALQASKKLYEKIKNEEQDPSDVEIKDEDTDDELVIEHDSVQPQNSTEDDAAPPSNSDRKNCPYCSSFFESGVGLSNHIRGHLHRIGLNYKARHKMSADKVATSEEKPRVGMGTEPRYHNEPQKDTDSEQTVKIIHSCPLCGDFFDNRTGQANHIRGHLKKLGKGLIAKHRSPLLLLRELMRDKNEYKRALEIIGKNNHVQHRPSSKLSDFHSFTPRSTDSVKDNCTDAKPLTPKLSFDDIISEKANQRPIRTTKIHSLATPQRMRPGPKKKILPLTQTPEEMYRLTCRFCDLVFQGPLSVQEDWVKHLQRHIMNTSVPHTGLAMTEVSSQLQQYAQATHVTYSMF
uniref:C2H2-type domain-containing protein n=1 Tax=Neogobius melanostomus TaxID=47308 RepID=A0A8C6TZ60_9GOBI